MNRAKARHRHRGRWIIKRCWLVIGGKRVRKINVQFPIGWKSGVVMPRPRVFVVTQIPHKEKTPPLLHGYPVVSIDMPATEPIVFSSWLPLCFDAELL